MTYNGDGYLKLFKLSSFISSVGEYFFYKISFEVFFNILLSNYTIFYILSSVYCRDMGFWASWGCCKARHEMSLCFGVKNTSVHSYFLKFIVDFGGVFFFQCYCSSEKSSTNNYTQNMKIENLKQFPIFLAHFGNFFEFFWILAIFPKTREFEFKIFFFQIFSGEWQHFITKRNH